MSKKRRTILEKFIEGFDRGSEVDLNTFKKEATFTRFSKKDVMDIVDELEKAGLIKTQRKRGSHSKLHILK